MTKVLCPDQALAVARGAHFGSAGRVTCGGEGSRIYTNEEGQEVEILITKVVDPTVAGDTYIGGLAFGLARGFPLEVVGCVAALTAAYAIEHRGSQEHYYRPAEFAERYADLLGSPAEIKTLARSRR